VKTAAKSSKKQSKFMQAEEEGEEVE